MRIAFFRYLLAVAEAGSLSQAAARLYISPQGLSRILAQAERELDVKLFSREGSRLFPTAAGLEFLEGARAIVGAYDRLGQRLEEQRTAASPVSGPFRIYAAPALSSSLLPALLTGVRRCYPRLKLMVLEASQQAILEAVPFDSRTLGLVCAPEHCFSPMPRRRSGTVLFDELHREPLMLAVSPHSPLAGASSVSRSDFLSLPLLLYQNERKLLADLFAPEQLPAVLLETTNDALLREAVFQNWGVGFTTALRQRYAKQVPLAAVPLDLDPPIQYVYGCAYAPESASEPIAVQIRAILRGLLD